MLLLTVLTSIRLTPIAGSVAMLVGRMACCGALQSLRGNPSSKLGFLRRADAIRFSHRSCGIVAVSSSVRAAAMASAAACTRVAAPATALASPARAQRCFVPVDSRRALQACRPAPRHQHPSAAARRCRAAALVVLSAAAEAVASPGDFVVAHYTIKTPDGQVFDRWACS